MTPGYSLHQSDAATTLVFSGTWREAHKPPTFAEMSRTLEDAKPRQLILTLDGHTSWDSTLTARLYQCWRWSCQRNIPLTFHELPPNLCRIMELAIAVPPRDVHKTADEHWYSSLNPLPTLRRIWSTLHSQCTFIGEVICGCGRLCVGRSDMPTREFWSFFQQCGPEALKIIGLISILVGMILAYLGAVQLRMFGAELYVADLVAIGMLREMGAFMTAIIVAGRTGAAYAAQLGSMQANEEIDALTTLGISPIDYLVIPRLLALIIAMPMLCIYADVLGILGGALVALEMDVSMVQFAAQARDAATPSVILIGVTKSLVFAMVIAVAGCKAGMASGRNSAAVGAATTRAVVSAIVWLVVWDAIFNIALSRLDI